MTDFTNLPVEVVDIDLWFYSSYKNLATLLGYNDTLIVVAQCYGYRIEVSIYEPECSLTDAWYPDGSEWVCIEVFDKTSGKLVWDSKDVNSYALLEFLEKV